jgi:hypothetical protein
VETSALGLTVRCPRCDATFVAVEEVEISTPIRPDRTPILPVPEPDLLPEPRRPRRRPPASIPEIEPTPAPEPNDDPHLSPSGPLPASVLIGLALLPFAIPILWLIAPAVTGVQPAMSIATPSALALAASILCLAVIYTIDWTPTTRIKGVLMLVGLAYFGAVSLYFLKKEMVEHIKRFTGLEDRVPWRDFSTRDYKIRLPGQHMDLDEQDQPLASLQLRYYTVTHERPLLGRLRFVCGSLRLPPNRDDGDAGKPGTAAWFDEVTREIVERSGGKKIKEPDTISYDDQPRGREVWIALPDEETNRVVRVYVIRGTVYYLSVQGMKVAPQDELPQGFFTSFQALSPRP